MQTDTSTRQSHNLIASDRVEGTPVRRSSGEKIGTIERLMIDKLSGNVAYAVLSFGGFRDFTRIAASDPTMWRDVFLHNRDAVLEMLGRFNEDVAALARAIRWGDGDTLFNLFSRTRAIRRGIVEIGQDSPAPDFGRPHPSLPLEPLPRPYAADSE